MFCEVHRQVWGLFLISSYTMVDYSSYLFESDLNWVGRDVCPCILAHHFICGADDGSGGSLSLLCLVDVILCDCLSCFLMVSLSWFNMHLVTRLVYVEFLLIHICIFCSAILWRLRHTKHKPSAHSWRRLMVQHSPWRWTLSVRSCQG